MQRAYIFFLYPLDRAIQDTTLNTQLPKLLAPWLLSFWFLGLAVQAEPIKTPNPGPQDTCPVCGMFVAKYPAWIATVLYEDDHAHYFDGAKDLFKYLLDMPKWAPGDNREDIRSVSVTEYYSLTRISAQKAWYVIGSDILGPMGHELIPLETQADAEEFVADHDGKRILRFKDVTLDLLKRLDAGRFE